VLDRYLLPNASDAGVLPRDGRGEPPTTIALVGLGRQNQLVEPLIPRFESSTGGLKKRQLEAIAGSEAPVSVSPRGIQPGFNVRP
jgi:hypothetical protein